MLKSVGENLLSPIPRLSRFLFALIFAPALGCESGESAIRVPPHATSHPVNIVLITLDTTRADHLSTYGYFRETSPKLDAFADAAIVFDRMIVPMATTLPSHISFLTGTYPIEHGVLANSTQGGRRFVPSSKLSSFAELSLEAGYRSAAFVSAAPLKRGSGAESGFEVFDQPSGKQRSGAATTQAALAWLREVSDKKTDRSRPFFLWVHYFDAHYPFTPPAPFKGMYTDDSALETYIENRRFSEEAIRPLSNKTDRVRDTINLYDAEIRFMDSQLGNLLAALRDREDWKNTAVVVAGDHGEGLCQHGLAAHGTTWDEQLHAPLLMRVPGVKSRRVATPLSGIDVLPTLLGMIDVPQREAFLAQSSGRDVLDSEYEDRAILSQDTGRERSEDVPFRYALSSGRWKLIRLEHKDGRVEEELYDRERDPHELRDSARIHVETRQKLSAELDAILATLRERGTSLREVNESATRDADRQVLEELEALGYVVDQPANTNDDDHDSDTSKNSE